MIPIFFQFTRNDSALEAGVRLLPLIFLMIFAVIMNGAILSVYGYYMPWYTVGGVFTAFGGGLMYTVNTDSSISCVYGYSIIIGFGARLFAQASLSVAQAVVEPHLIPSAVSFMTCAQVSGVSIFLNKSQTGIEKILPGVPVAEIQPAIAGARSQFVDSLSEGVKLELLEVIVSAMSKTYILVITAGLLVTVLSIALKRERLFIAASGAA
jgi:hypothetical protein